MEGAARLESRGRRGEPLALRGVAYRPLPAAKLLRRNLVVYGGGGVLLPFVAIKAIDLLVNLLRLA